MYVFGHVQDANKLCPPLKRVPFMSDNIEINLPETTTRTRPKRRTKAEVESELKKVEKMYQMTLDQFASETQQLVEARDEIERLQAQASSRADDIGALQKMLADEESSSRKLMQELETSRRQLMDQESNLQTVAQQQESELRETKSELQNIIQSQKQEIASMQSTISAQTTIIAELQTNLEQLQNRVQRTFLQDASFERVAAPKTVPELAPAPVKQSRAPTMGTTPLIQAQPATQPATQPAITQPKRQANPKPVTSKPRIIQHVMRQPYSSHELSVLRRR